MVATYELRVKDRVPIAYSFTLALIVKVAGVNMLGVFTLVITFEHISIPSPLESNELILKYPDYSVEEGLVISPM